MTWLRALLAWVTGRPVAVTPDCTAQLKIRMTDLEHDLEARYRALDVRVAALERIQEGYRP